MFVPKDFKPKSLVTDTYIARKLCAKDVYLDYIAVISSIEIIKSTRGGNWPSKDLTVEEDLIDLCWHQREFEFSSSFAFTVMNKEENECLGCIYFYPQESGMSSLGGKVGYEVSVSWWVTQKMFDQGLYEKLSWDILEWIKKDWPFNRVYFSNKVLPSNFAKDLIK